MFKRGTYIVYAIGVAVAAPVYAVPVVPQFHSRLDDFYDHANDHDVRNHKFDGLCDRLDLISQWLRHRVRGWIN